MLYNIAIFVFVLVCIMLMGIILLQSSKSGGMGSAMGGQAINTAFGGQGADNLLIKITSILAVSFMVLAIVIGMMENPNSRIDFSNKSTLSRNAGTQQSEDTDLNLIEPKDLSLPVDKNLDDSK
jgi:preprotein translocase subunit SecG